MTVFETPISPVELDFSVPGPNGQALLASQEENESSARTYPRRLPVAIAQASGSYVTDVDGRVYIDFLTGAGVLALGHNHPALVAAVQDQLTRLTHGLDFPTPVREEFKRNQLAMLPAALRDDMKIHFCGPTGSDAVEAAVKLCKKATGRGGLVAFQGSYHGSTQGAMSLTSETHPKDGLQNLLPGIHFAPYAYCHRCPLALTPVPAPPIARSCWPVPCTTPTAACRSPRPSSWSSFRARAGRFRHRPISSSGSPRSPGSWTSRSSSMRCRPDAGAPARGTCSSSTASSPDVIIASKGLSGLGLPVSVILYRSRLDGWGPGSHIGTFRGNNLAFASGNAYLEVLRRENVLDNVQAQGWHLLTRLDELRRSTSLISDVRGLGLILGMEMAAVRPRR